MNAMKQPEWIKAAGGLNATRGGRISRRGFRLQWAGLAILPIGLVAQLAKPGPVVDFALIGLMVALVLAGVAVTYAGHRIDNRALAEYHRRVAAGEQPPWRPGDPNPLA